MSKLYRKTLLLLLTVLMSAAIFPLASCSRIEHPGIEPSNTANGVSVAAQEVTDESKSEDGTEPPESEVPGESTNAPTDLPTEAATEPTDSAQTDAPTEPAQTDEPTEAPTDEPTEEPTEEPTATPVPEPTAALTATPKPTAAPTATPKPTAAPTATPKPTAAPTATPKPTAEPTPTPVPTGNSLSERFRDIVLPINVRYDYFAIPEEILGLMTPGDREMYRRVAVAFFSGDNYVDIPSGMGSFPNLWRVIDMYFPVFFIDVTDTTIQTSGSRITWQYTTSNYEQHLQQIRRFENRVDFLLSPVVQSDTTIMKVLSLFKDFTSRLIYNDSHVIPGDKTSPHVYRHSVTAMMDNIGVCYGFARGYNFLLCQLGIDSLTVHGLRRGDNAVHEWTVFKWNNEWRYADPSWCRGGKKLTFFGFTIRSREADGYPEADVSVLEGKSLRASQYFDVSGEFFKPLYSGEIAYNVHYVNYRLNRSTGKIEFINASNQITKTFNTANGSVQ